MEIEDKTSYLMMFGALLLARCRRMPLSRALSVAPFSGRTRKLADRLGANEGASKERLGEGPGSQSSPAIQPSPANSVEKSLDYTPGGLYGPAHGIVTEIESTDVRMRCPVCRNVASFTLDYGQMEHLRIQGHMESYCVCCGARSLWEPMEPTHSSPSAERPEAAIRNILVADSDTATADLLQKLAGAWDAQVTVVSHGKEAMQKLAEKRFDLLICELHLDDMDGRDLCQYIRDGQLLTPQQVIFVGSENPGVIRDFLDASGCGYCRKPIRFLELSSQAEAWLRGDHPEEQQPPNLVI